MGKKYGITEDSLLQYRLSLKWRQCPNCSRTGLLVGHGFLRGYSATGEDRIVRGRRFFCSDRFRKTGCGRTFSVLLSDMMRGFVVTATILWQFLVQIENGVTPNAAWRAVGQEFSVESGHRLLRYLKKSQSHLRTILCRVRPPPECTSTNPLLQLTAHFRATFPLSSCPFSSFQNHFQEPLLR